MGMIEAGQGGSSADQDLAQTVDPAPVDRHRIALSYVPHGVCMFDASLRLVFCNEGYAELYALPDRLSEPGTPLAAILEHRVAHGSSPTDLDTYFDVASVALESGRHAATRVRLKDGRTLQITHNPMPGGGYVAVHEDVSAHVDVENRLRHLVDHDQLTGLCSRHAFGERLTGALLATEQGAEIAVHCLDLDRFKAVNDALGHHAGDMLLQRVAKRLRECTQHGEIVGRLGGDEFIVMQPRLPGQDAARALASRIVERLARPYRLNQHVVSIGTSVGIAIHPTDGSTPDELLKNADRALYMAKAEGGNGFRMFRGQPGRNVQPLAQIA